MRNAGVPAGAITAETIQLAKEALSNPQPVNGPGLRKAGFNIAEGLEGVNLEAPSKKLFPVYSPLRNKIARIQAPVGASAVQWRQIDEINSNKLRPGVAENARNTFNTTLTTDKTASFKTLGHDDYVGFEALSRSKGFEDIRATAALNLLYSVMISEESVILGGNSTDIGGPVAVATPVQGAAAGGALADGNYFVRVSALTLGGQLQAQKAGATLEANGESIPTNSAVLAIAAGSGTASMSFTFDDVKGAVAYNVFVTDPGDAVALAKFHSTITVNTLVVLVLGTGVVGNTTDLTGDALEFDGIISQIETNATGNLYKSLDGAKLTSDTAAGIVEFDDILEEMWNVYRLGPSQIIVNAQQAKDVTKIIGGSTGVSMQIYLQDGQRNIVGGVYVGAYLNKFASAFAEGFPNEIPINIHPDLPAGTIIFYVGTLPYPNNQVPNVWEIEALQEYTQYEWALATRRYEFGIYHQEVLKGYFPKAQATLVCVGKS